MEIDLCVVDSRHCRGEHVRSARALEHLALVVARFLDPDASTLRGLLASSVLGLAAKARKQPYEDATRRRKKLGGPMSRPIQFDSASLVTLRSGDRDNATEEEGASTPSREIVVGGSKPLRFTYCCMFCRKELPCEHAHLETDSEGTTILVGTGDTRIFITPRSKK